MTIFAILLLLLLLAFVIRKLYDRFWDRGLSCRISFQEEYAVEDDLSSLHLVMENDKLLPLPVAEIDFHMDRRLQFADGQNNSVSDQTYRRDVFALFVRQRITRTLDFKCVGRGYFRIEKAGLTAQDLFLTRKYLSSYPQNTEFYVLPRPVPTGQINIPFTQVMGAVLSRKKIYDDPFEFAGLREYSRGDPMKYINWKASARAGELLTNFHESTLSQKVVILLDMEGKGVQQADVLNEAAVRIACSLSERLLLSGIELGVYSNGTDVQTGARWKLESVSGAGSGLFLKKRFACVQSENGLPPIWECAPRIQGPGREEDLLVLVSRSLRPETAENFSRLAGKGKGLRIVPWHDEKGSIPHWPNVDVLWMEV